MPESVHWVWLPPWGMRAALALGVVLALAAVFRLLRERRQVGWARQRVGFALRLFAIAVLVWIAMNPVWMRPRVAGGKPRLAVLVDTSASMAVKDEGGRSRLQAALDRLAAPETLARLERDFVLDVRAFDRQSRPADLRRLGADEARGDATDLAAALSGAIRDLEGLESQAGILVVSDGRSTSGGVEDTGVLALARSIPIWTWCLGGPVARRDLWMEVPAAEVLAFSGADVELTGLLRQVGYADRALRVELAKDGVVAGRVELRPPEERAVFTVKAPASGEQRYVFRAVAEPDEADGGNNERSVWLRAVGEKVRVLVADGSPHWDTKFLVHTLKRDPHVDVTAVYRLGPKRYFSLVSASGAERREERSLFPQSAEELAAFDVLIFGRGCEAFFEEATDELLAEAVGRRGLGLIFARGKPYGGRFLPLAKYEPVVWGKGADASARLTLAPGGKGHPIFEWGLPGGCEEWVARLPAFDRVACTLGEKPLAVVLASSDQAPARGGDEESAERATVLAWQRFGQGKAVTMNAAGLWRWAFRQRGTEEEEVVYARFWNALLRWMISDARFMPGADVAFSSAQRYYTDEQPMQFWISAKGGQVRGYRPRLTIERTGGAEAGAGPQGPALEIEPVEQRPGAYLAEAGPFPPGIYRAVLRNNVGTPAQIELSVDVLRASTEHRELSADPEALRRLAERSGGQALTADEAVRLDEVVRRWNAARQRAMEQTTVWDRWWIWAALMAALGLEWFLRRREGLL